MPGHGRGWLPLIGLTALLGSGVALALPSVLGRTVDTIVAKDNIATWLTIAGGLVLLGIACDLVDSFATTAAVAGTAARLRHQLVRRVLAGGPDGVREHDTGDLVSRVSGSAVDAARAGPAKVTAFAAAIPPAGSLVLLALIDPWLAAAFFIGVLLVIAVLWLFARRTAAVSLAYAETQGRIASVLTEALAGIRTIAAAGTASAEKRRVLYLLPELHRQGLETWRVLARSGAQAAVVGPLVLVSVLAVGGLQLAAGRITPGDLFAAAQYAVLGAGLGSLTGVLGELARAKAGLRRIDLGIEPVAHGTLSLPPGPGRLTFDKVAAEGLRIELEIQGGSTVAVVGSGGAGKSVFAELAARLRDPKEGQILLDGIPLQALSSQALRAAVGCAFERPTLVGATVGEAISSGSVNPVRTLAATHATRAHDFISRLPAGYGTPLLEAPMSGGERQRLGLARAWRAERLLVLDDATSSLDTATELKINQALANDPARRTKLVVTHRAATAARADLVLWLHRGRVRGFAPHERLWQDPAYRKAFR
ncbi:ABC transporter ATP-binding protein [Kribbella deserti]|uniref:ABC transporter ATP-binding protein n=1 Tax=Kribbella deserti TaxID=1926257 RepID=A0ABV6QQW0_9ACTN